VTVPSAAGKKELRCPALPKSSIGKAIAAQAPISVGQAAATQLIIVCQYSDKPLMARKRVANSASSLSCRDGTLVLFSKRQRCGILNTHCHEVAPSRDPPEPAALAAGVRPDCSRGRETEP